MIYAVLLYEFLMIGLVAIGGGLVTIPFLAKLSSVYGWFSLDELTDMIAISEVTPGTIGINMATFAGYKTAGICGGIAATLGLALPAFLILMLFSKYIVKYKTHPVFQNILFGIRPVAIALILYAGWLVGKLSLTEWRTQLLAAVLLVIACLKQKSPIFYIVIGAIVGVLFEL
jgi:chromate transporter